MNRRRWCIGLAAVCLLLLSGAVLVLLCNRLPLSYYVQVPGARVLPQDLIRPAFRFVADRELPTEASDLQGIFDGGLDPGIFVRFCTDPCGIEYVLEAFDQPGAESRTLDANYMRRLPASVWRVFAVASDWEQKVGVRLFHQESIESGRVLEYFAPPGSNPAGYKIFIDDKNMTVYIFAYHF